MAKAITEVAIGAAAIGAAIAMPGIGAGLAWMTLGMQNAATGALVGLGGSSLMAGLSDALKPSQGGIAIGVATPIGPWGYVYGRQKVGGVELFRQCNSSQGTSNNKEMHRVYALDCHPSQINAGPFELHIDGKAVSLVSSGSGYASVSPTQIMRSISSMSRDINGLVTFVLSSGLAGLDGTSIQITEARDNTFNGIWIVTQPNPSDNTTFNFVCGGPVVASVTGGQCWTLYPDYKNKIYVEFLNGNHTATFPGLLASGTSWSASDLCLGRTLMYLRMGYDAAVFPSSIPNVSVVMNGKNDILDPRTGARGYTSNAALCIADYLSLPATKGGFGLTIGSDIPTAGLIAAANICDEAVPLAGGGTIPRYTCNTFFQLNMGRGAILKQMLSSCGGRISYQGGQYFIHPAAWVAPTLALTTADLMGPIKWNPRHSIRDTCNAVKGTYVSPENSYQQADVPPYMMDLDHGYAVDPWLAEDKGERIFKEASFPCTDNSATAQRLEKIALMRVRYQGRGTLICSMKAYQAVALDVITLTHARYTWLNKAFEVLNSRFVIDKSQGAPRLSVELDIAETDSTIYDWSIMEQLTPQGYAQPDNIGNSVCVPPNHLVVYSGSGTVVDGVTYPSTISTGADGSVKNSLYVAWDTPNDANVVSGGHLEVQWQLLGAASWTAWGKLDPSASHCFIDGVSDGLSYMVQVRAVNCIGVPSAWVIAGPETVSSTFSVFSYSGVWVAPPGTLRAQANADGTAQILVMPFTSSVNLTSCSPSPALITGLNQGQFYDVYYIDLAFAGGAITPIATQDSADFLGKAGYFLIGSLVTPTYVVRYQPSSYSDVGTQGTSNPGAAYDNNILTDAMVSGEWQSQGGGPPPITWGTVTWVGKCIWAGFPVIALAAAATLNITAAADGDAGMTASLSVSIGGVLTVIQTFTAPAAEDTYTFPIPAGTNLNTVSVIAECSIPGGTPGPGLSGSASLSGFEIWIQ